MSHRGGSDHEVVGADRRPGAAEVVTDDSIVLGAGVVERKRGKSAKKFIQQTKIGSRARAMASSIRELRFHGGAKADTGRTMLSEPGNQGGRSVVQDTNAGIRIQQEYLSQMSSRLSSCI